MWCTRRGLFYESPAMCVGSRAVAETCRTQERRNERSSVRYNCRDVRETGGAASTPRLGEEKTRSAAREAESKVIVSKGRIEFAAQRDTADSLRVAPRPAARGASHAVDGTGRIPLR